MTRTNWRQVDIKGFRERLQVRATHKSVLIRGNFHTINIQVVVTEVYVINFIFWSLTGIIGLITRWRLLVKWNKFSNEFDLNGSNWLIKDTPFDHMTKLNFKKTLRQMGAFSFVNGESNAYSSITKTANARLGRSKIATLSLIILISR